MKATTLAILLVVSACGSKETTNRESFGSMEELRERLRALGCGSEQVTEVTGSEGLRCTLALPGTSQCACRIDVTAIRRSRPIREKGISLLSLRAVECERGQFVPVMTSLASSYIEPGYYPHLVLLLSTRHPRYDRLRTDRDELADDARSTMLVQQRLGRLQATLTSSDDSRHVPGQLGPLLGTVTTELSLQFERNTTEYAFSWSRSVGIVPTDRCNDGSPRKIGAAP